MIMNTITYRRKLNQYVKRTAFFLLSVLSTTQLLAQGESTLLVQVTPVQDILPPQVGDYKANPGKYFTVTITNTTAEEIRTYLAVQIMKTFENDGTTPSNLSVSSPPTRMPGSPIIVPANGSVDLSMEQMRRIFDHIPLSEMQFSSDLFSQFGAADYGLLPEGQYKVLLSAYKWDPLLVNSSTGRIDSPVALSNPSVTGYNFFRVCYRAQAPQFIEPTASLGTTTLYNLEAVKFPLMNPVFSWTEPVLNCWRENTPMYQYTLRVYEIFRNGEIMQSPDDALLNYYIFQIPAMTAPTCILDQNAIKRLQDGHLYAAQVTATPIGITDMDFMMVENKGGSQVLIFTPDLSGEVEFDEAEVEEEEDEEDLALLGVMSELGETDADYVFQNPQLIKPDFEGNTNNTLFAGNTVISEWKRPLHAGGEGEKPDTLKFRYKVQVYNLGGYATRELALEQEPIYEGLAKGKYNAVSDLFSGSKGNISVSADTQEERAQKEYETNVELIAALKEYANLRSSGATETELIQLARIYGLTNEQMKEVLEIVSHGGLAVSSSSASSSSSTTDVFPGKTGKDLSSDSNDLLPGGKSTGTEKSSGETQTPASSSAQYSNEALAFLQKYPFDHILTANELARLKTLEQHFSKNNITVTSVEQAKAKIAVLEAKNKELKEKYNLSVPDDPNAGVDVLEDFIKWASFSGNVSVGQALILRVVPENVGADKVTFYGDVNEITFMFSDRLSEAFGDACAGGVIEENRIPWKISEKEMAGKEIFVGEYIMTMGDDLKFDSKTQGWTGSGWMLWTPFGQKVKVGVKFENIFINSDRIMYGGTVKTETKSNWQHIKERAKAYADSYKDTSELGDWIPDDIFTEWGLDNLVGYALPPEMSNTTLGAASQAAANAAARAEANSLAAKVEASKYYDYIRKGYAIYDNFQKKGVGGYPDIEVFLPLQISDVHKTPVDIQILSMEFHPTFAWMNLMGMFTLPDNDITNENILIFGAPRTCMDPDRVLPGSGVVMLMSNVTLNDKKSSFDFTFKTPANFDDPTDGCYIKWDNDTLSALSMEAEMTIPGLIKCNQYGNIYQDQNPKVKVHAWINTWEDWIGSVSMDPFTHEDVKGWVFTANEVTYDHSQKKNPTSLKFPVDQGFKKDEAGIINNDDLSWQGLYINKLDVKMPKGLVSDSQISLSADNMLVDVSGVSLSFNVNKLLNVSYGGWKMRLDHIFMNIVQNNFKDCGFDGAMAVPLMQNNMAFKCNFYPFEREDGSTDFDCVLKCTNEDQLKNISFDFFLAELELDMKQTYFLLESTASENAGGDRTTRVELCMGGDITIGGANTINQSLAALTADLPLKLQIPGIHFTQMRIANCERWIVDEDKKYGKEIAKLQNEASDQSRRKNTGFALYEICKQNTYQFGNDFYFERGWWSVASVEKKVGPFKFGIKKFNVIADVGAKTAGLSITGRMALMDKGDTYDNNKMDDNSLICVDLTLDIMCDVNVENKSFKYKETRFNEIALNANFCGVSLSGGLAIGNGTSTSGTSKGYKGFIKVVLPGDLLEFEADGGFFEHSAGYKWGYVYLGAGGKMGIQITPLKITKIGAGIYFNCYSSAADKNKVTPQKGLVGVMADLGLASSDGELLSGDFHMSVLYDKSKNRLTTFLFTGDCKAVAGIIDSKVTIQWQNDATDKYFQLTATVDATADGSTIMNALGQTVGASEIARQMKLLNDKWEAAKGAVTGTLEGAMGDESTTKADKKTNANLKDVNEEKAKGPKMGAHASLDFKLTFRENGVNLSKCKWHIYLGEPEEKKRCSFTLIDFKSKIVSVNIGANFYFCVGNELPNNGELPEIPVKIRTFLNGESKGGMEGADMTKANNARKKALSMFKKDADIKGGVMVGASEYGYVDVDLGLFYGDMGAVAGFDVTLAKLAHTDCPGYGTMGYKGWYAEGQLYAYLYAKFGIYVNLGFWDKKFNIIDAGIGGVLKAGLPHPSYFVGDARIKLKLLGGLVNINRRFQFECGHVCNIWYGNPLDNFELFGDCTLGSANVHEGWAKDAELISPSLIAKPIYNTQAPMGEHFRVLDENELHRMEQGYDGDITDLEMQAKRTFVFRHKSLVSTNIKPVLMEFSVMPDTTDLNSNDQSVRMRKYDYLLNHSQVTRYYITTNTVGQTVFRLEDIAKNLKANRYYVLAVSGNAMEIIKGKEENPREYKDGKWQQKEWTQVQFYFFRTGSASPAVEDVTELDDYVALAYPSDKGQLRPYLKADVVDNMKDVAVTNSSYVNVYLEDAQRPNIALNQQIWALSGSSYYKRSGYPLQNTANLYWMFKFASNGAVVSKQASIITGSNTRGYNTQNITLTSNLPGLSVGTKGILALVYKFVEYGTHTEKKLLKYETVNGVTSPVYSEVVVKDATDRYKVLMALNVNIATSNNWKTGYSTSQFDYCKPFVGIRLSDIKYDYTWSKLTDETIRDNDEIRMRDPYCYLSYLANYFFIGGHPITNYSFETMETPVAESVIYYTKGGQTSGNLVSSSHSNIADGYQKIYDLSVYSYGLYYPVFGNYPLPVMKDVTWTPLISASPRTPFYKPSTDSKTRAKNLLGDIASTYYLAQKASRMFVDMRNLDWTECPGTWQAAYDKFGYKTVRNTMQNFNNRHRSVYKSLIYSRPNNSGIAGQERDSVSVQIPWYQLPLVFGATFNHGGNTKYFTLEESVPTINKDGNNRHHRQYSSQMFFRMAGGATITDYSEDGDKYIVKKISFSETGKGSNGVSQTREEFWATDALKHITQVDYTIYRVNAYDFDNGYYTINSNVGLNNEERVSLSKPFNSWVNDGK